MAIRVLDESALRIIMVADENNYLLGTVSDGDIRRALIEHSEMSTQLVNVMNKFPITIPGGTKREKVLKTMKNKNIHQLPILDSIGKIIGLETLQNFLGNNKRDNLVFVLAGGFGTRLKPLTNTVPKPLLKVGDKPVMGTIIHQFSKKGFHNFYISAHYKANMVRKHFGDGSQWDISIKYVNEEQPLGTAGPLSLLPKDILDKPVFVINGDLLTNVNFETLLDYHIEQDGIATMGVRKYEIQVPFGEVRSNNQKIVSIVEKPTHVFFVNAGIYVLNPSLIKSLDFNKYLNMPQLIEEQIKNGEEVNMFPVHEYWLDIGQTEDYAKAQIDSVDLFE